jgi:hypothetical protein
MFGRWTFAIYSGSSCNFAWPRAQFTRRGGRTLGGIDRLPIVRAIAPIRLPANEITIRYEAFFFFIETGSLPRTVAPTLVTLPSMLGAP